MLTGVVAHTHSGPVFAALLNEVTPVVVKRLRITASMGDNRRHLGVLLSLRHPNIVQVLGIATLPQIFVGTVVVMERLPCTLSQTLADTTVDLVESVRVSMAADVARGLSYLHTRRSRRILHRDVKCSNVLLRRGCTAVLADFGFSRYLILTEVLTQLGTPAYAAPELIRGEPYNEKVDVFAFGVVLYEIMTRRRPYQLEPRQPSAVMRRVLAGERPSWPRAANGDVVHAPFTPTVFIALRAMAEDCWLENPRRRPAMAKIAARLQILCAGNSGSDGQAVASEGAEAGSGSGGGSSSSSGGGSSSAPPPTTAVGDEEEEGGGGGAASWRSSSSGARAGLTEEV